MGSKAFHFVALLVTLASQCKSILAEESLHSLIIDKSEYDKRPRVKYHLYDPQLFAMYKDCLPKLGRPCFKGHDFKHTLDVNFVEAIIALNQSVDPWDATLFIVPVFFNQVDNPNYPCSQHAAKHIAQMYTVLDSQGYYKPGVRNHFLMADHWSSGHPRNWTYGQKFKFKPEFIIGKYEQPALSIVFKWTVEDMDATQFMVVGYATRPGILRQCPYVPEAEPPLSIHNRTYVASFAGGTTPTPNNGLNTYLYRNLLFDYYLEHDIPNDTVIAIFDKTKPSPKKPHVWIDGNDLMRNSLMVLHLSSDTATTDRIWTAFEHLTLIGAVYSEMIELLPQLPFAHRIPWIDIIVWIDTYTYIQNPVEAMRGTAKALTYKQREHHYRLMKKHRRDVLWSYNESIAVYNVIEEAALHVKVLDDE